VIVSLVAESAGGLAGHILFSRLPIETEKGIVDAVALAPMAVRPAMQLKGIGSSLVRRGLALCRDRGERIVVVVGHPSYYPRFGFSARAAEVLKSPFSGEIFMAMPLVPGALEGVTGTVRYPSAFDETAGEARHREAGAGQ
jgi:putative acetyltransferase